MFGKTQAYGTTDDDYSIVDFTSRGPTLITLLRFVDTCPRELSRHVGMLITQHINRCGQYALAPCSSAYAVCMGNQLTSKSSQMDLDSHFSTVRGSEGVFFLEMDGLPDEHPALNHPPVLNNLPHGADVALCCSQSTAASYQTPC